MPKPLSLLLVCMLAEVGCGNQNTPASHREIKREQVLPLTLGGFLKDGPEEEKVEGICTSDDTRALVNCDIHNGLQGWTITEVTLFVGLIPYEKNSGHYYRVSSTIKPLTTERLAVRLGLQLPPGGSWSWQTVGAKGYPSKDTSSPTP